MSFDISLKDRVTGDVLELPFKHVMTGGTYRADYNEKTGVFTPAPISEAELNVTYNYSNYYYEASKNDKRFGDAGIRGLDGKTGLESITMLKDLITRIESKYKKNGEWIVTTRTKPRALDEDGNELNINDIFSGKVIVAKTEDYSYDISEGNTNDYWEATAANALKPLYQLLTMAELRPDGIWEVL